MDALRDLAAGDGDLAPLANEALLLLDFLRRDPDCPPPCATGRLPAWARPDDHPRRAAPALGLRGAATRDVVLSDPSASETTPPPAAGAHPILAERRSLVSAKRAWAASAAALSGVLDETGRAGDGPSTARLDSLAQEVRQAAAQAESALRLLVSSLELGGGGRAGPGSGDPAPGGAAPTAWASRTTAPAAWEGPPSPLPVEGEGEDVPAPATVADAAALPAVAPIPLRRRRRSSSFAPASVPPSSRGGGALRPSRSTPDSLSSAWGQAPPDRAQEVASQTRAATWDSGLVLDAGDGAQTPAPARDAAADPADAGRGVGTARCRKSDTATGCAPAAALTPDLDHPDPGPAAAAARDARPHVEAELDGGAAAPDGAAACLSPPSTGTATACSSAATRSAARGDVRLSPSPVPPPRAGSRRTGQAPSAWPHPHVVAWARPRDHCDWLLARFTSQQRARFALPARGTAFAPHIRPQLRVSVCGRAPHADAVPALRPRPLSPFVGVGESESGFLLVLEGPDEEWQAHDSPLPPSPLQATAGHGLLAYLTDRGEVLAARGTLPFPAVTAARPLLLHRLYRGHRVVAVASGQNHAVAVTEDGCLFTWGSGEHGCLGHGGAADHRDPRPVEALASHRVRAAACGGSHTVCCTEQGLVFAWGRAADGRLGVGTTSQPAVDLPYPVRHEAWKRLAVVAVACGWSHTAAISADGALWAWGAGQGGHEAAPEAALFPHRVPLCRASSGAPSASAASGDGGTAMLGAASTKAVLVRCGFAHSMALAADGTLWAWGEGGQGELGLGPDVQRAGAAQAVPLPPGASPPEDRVVEVQCGLHHTVALTATGRVFAWGHNQGGLLGTGDERPRPWPEWVTSAPPAARATACATTSTLLFAAPAAPGEGPGDHTGAVVPEEGGAARAYRVPPREGVQPDAAIPDDVRVMQACARVFAQGESPDAEFRSTHRVAPGLCLAQDEAGLAELAAAAAAGAALGGLPLDDVAPSVPGLHVGPSAEAVFAPTSPRRTPATGDAQVTPTHSVSSMSVAHGIDATGALERPATPDAPGSVATEAAATPGRGNAVGGEEEWNAPRSRSGSSELRECPPTPSPSQQRTELCGFAERPGTAVADTSRFEKGSLGKFRAFTAADFARWAVGAGPASTLRQGLHLLARLCDAGLVCCLDAAEGAEPGAAPHKRMPFSGEAGRATHAGTPETYTRAESLWRRYRCASPPPPLPGQAIRWGLRSHSPSLGSRFALHETAAGAAASLVEGALLLALTAHLLRTVEVKNRSYRLRSARRCFVPSEAVTSLVEHGLARTAEEAARRCTALLDVGLVEAVVPRNSGSLRRDAATRFHQTHGCFYRIVPHVPPPPSSAQATSTNTFTSERELEQVSVLPLPHVSPSAIFARFGSLSTCQQHWQSDLLPKMRSQRDLASVFRGWRRGLPPRYVALQRPRRGQDPQRSALTQLLARTGLTRVRQHAGRGLASGHWQHAAHHALSVAGSVAEGEAAHPSGRAQENGGGPPRPWGPVEGGAEAGGAAAGQKVHGAVPKEANSGARHGSSRPPGRQVGRGSHRGCG